jgi:hypothetical protein
VKNPSANFAFLFLVFKVLIGSHATETSDPSGNRTNTIVGGEKFEFDSGQKGTF